MNSFEIFGAVIWAIIVVVMITIPLFMMIAGLVKNEIDKEEKESTGIVGWIIAIPHCLCHLLRTVLRR